MFDVIKGCNGESNCFGRRKIATCGYYNVQCSLQIEELKKKSSDFSIHAQGLRGAPGKSGKPGNKGQTVSVLT